MRHLFKMPKLSSILYARTRLRGVLRIIPKLALLTLLVRPKLSSARNLNAGVYHELRASGLFKDSDYGYINERYKLWEKADYLFGRGEFWQSVQLRREILTDIYKFQGITDSNHFPPMIGSPYSVAIGHIGSLLVHRMAVEVDILPQGSRTVIKETSVGNIEAIKYVGYPTSGSNKFNTTNFIVLANLVENYQMVRGRGNFIDKYELWEKVFSSRNKVIDDFLKKCELRIADYVSLARREVESKYNPDGKPIALIHLRNNGNKKETRNVMAEDYVEAVKLLNQKGFATFQIGANRSNSLARYINEITCLSTEGDRHQLLDFYLLSNCSFYIGTNSGPTLFPLLLGKPSLITNVTSISRAALSGAAALYLPKKILTKRNKPLSLEQTFNSRFSFGGEFLHTQLSKNGLKLQDNSKEEICEGIEELISRLSVGVIRATSLDIQISEIQSSAKTVAKGKIANSFIQKNYLAG